MLDTLLTLIEDWPHSKEVLYDYLEEHGHYRWLEGFIHENLWCAVPIIDTMGRTFSNMGCGHEDLPPIKDAVRGMPLRENHYAEREFWTCKGAKRKCWGASQKCSCVHIRWNRMLHIEFLNVRLHENYGDFHATFYVGLSHAKTKMVFNLD